jgi:RecB family exonuclease
MITTESCKSKKDQPVPEQKTTAPVEINTDQELRTSVTAVLNDYKEVRADINNGVITLTGTIKQDELQKLIMRLQELKPKKVENQLVIK